jgi:hypothetical protein
MWTAILATLNVVDGADHDVWSVNTESDYLEEGELVEALLEFSAADVVPSNELHSDTESSLENCGIGRQ